MNVGMVVVGALMLAAKGIFAKVLYSRGVSVEALLVLRSLISLPLIMAWAAMRVGLQAIVRVERRAAWGALTAGILGYYIGAWLDFTALTLIDASLERVLLFSYPVFIVAARAAIHRAWPGRKVMVAVLTTYFGVILAVGGFDLDLWRANATGACLVMITAMTFTYYLLANERLAASIGSIGFLVYAMGSATAALCVHFLLFGAWHELLIDTRSWFVLGVMTVTTNVLPMLMIAEGVKRIGAQRAAIISAVGPPATIFMGVFILGETLSAAQLAGSAFIIGGIVVLETRLADNMLRWMVARTGA